MIIKEVGIFLGIGIFSWFKWRSGRDIMLLKVYIYSVDLNKIVIGV